MAPMDKALSRTSSQGSMYQNESVGLQAGRSSTNLHAQAAAASIREAERSSSPAPSRSTSTPNLLRKANSRATSKTRSSDLLRSTAPMPSLLSPHRSATHTPTSSSPLNLTASTSSDSSRPSTGRTRRQSATDGSALAQGQSVDGEKPVSSPYGHSRATTLKPPEMTQRDVTGPLTRQATPQTVRDLGQDYTRYFNPFADSHSSSFADLHKALPSYNSSSNLVSASAATNRLSNPFEPRDTRELNPFATASSSTTNLVNDSDPEKNFSPYLDDRLAAPSSDIRYPLYMDEKEWDDDMHMPMFDDDVKLKPKWRDHFTRDNVVSTFGLAFMIVGLLFVFVFLPVMSYTGVAIYHSPYDTPLDQMPKFGDQRQAWAVVNNLTYPLLRNIRKGLIDPTTPQSAMTRTSLEGEQLQLIFSDEFNDNNRTFYPGDDPYFFAPDIWYGATQDLEWFDPDAVTTWNGTLELRLDKFPNHGVLFRSGMLNSWNQLCFKGGVFEVSISLPGPGGVQGYWPGAWTMGNLGRPGYLSTTEGLWPYTYNECDVGITPNQSSPDGISHLPGQRLPSCTCPNQDHPNPGTGRGAPEIDIIEAGANGAGTGIVTQSLQVAPFDIWYYPDAEFMETPNYNISMVNTYTGGPFQQAVSATSLLNNNWYDGKLYQKYAFEYVPGTGKGSYIAWFVGDDETMKMDGRAIGPNGNIGARQVPEEPMSLVLNFGISDSWTYIDWAALTFPAIMRVDYVRWYQKKGSEMVTCDPPGYETTQYIKDHPVAYNNPNLTHWDQTGYGWPTNKFTSQC